MGSSEVQQDISGSFDSKDVIDILRTLIQKYKELKEKYKDINDIIKDKESFTELFNVIGEILQELRQLSEFNNETIEKLYNIYQNIMERYNTIYQNDSEVELEEVNNYMELYNAKPNFPFSEYGFRQPADTELRVIPKDIKKIDEEYKKENLVRDEIVKLNVDIDLFIVSLNKVIDIFNKKYNLVQEEKSSTNELMINNQKKSGFNIFERIKNAIKKIFSKNNIVADVPYVEVNSNRDNFLRDLKIEAKTNSQKELSTENNQEEKVETFGKGKWIRFAEGYNKTEEDNYDKIISILKQKAPWLKNDIVNYEHPDGICLYQKDLYIFVDNTGKPHISITLYGDEVFHSNINGAKKLNQQNSKQIDTLRKVEEEYRDVAKSFLTNNKGIYDEKILFDYDEWNNRLSEYIKKIDDEQITLEDIPSLLRDYLINYSYVVTKNSNKNAIKIRLEKIKGLLAQYWGISEDEIYIGDINYEYTNIKTVPYKVILGNADFEYSQIESLGDLFMISGSANFRDSIIKDINPLTLIGGSADFGYSKFKDTGSLNFIGLNAFFGKSHIKKLINVKWIGLHAFFQNSNVVDIGPLEHIGGDANLWGSEINKVEHLKDIGGNADFRWSRVTEAPELENIGGCLDTGNQMQALNKLKRIGCYIKIADESKLEGLPNLQVINYKDNNKWGNRKDLLEEYKKRKEAYELEKNKSMGDSVISPEEAMKMFYNNTKSKRNDESER